MPPLHGNSGDVAPLNVDFGALDQKVEVPAHVVAMIQTEAELAYVYWYETATDAQKANYETG